MIYRWYVMSVNECEKYCKQTHSQNSIIISINNSFETPVKLNQDKTNGVKEILTLCFDDVFKHNLTNDPKYPHIWIDKAGRAFSPITEKDAKQIYDFVMKYHKMKEYYNLIVHCEFGISRSAGVMAGILKGLYDDDFPIFSNNKYRPNTDVYRAVYNEFTKNLMEVSIIQKSDLRFGKKKTPYQYSPIFDMTSIWNDAEYTPSVELVEILPCLKSVVEFIPNSFGSGLPYLKFPFAIYTKDETNNKGSLITYFSSDENYKNTDNKDDYKNTIAWKLIELAKHETIPDISKVTNVDTDGIITETYNLLLYNRNSPYFYQQSFDFDGVDIENISSVTLEVEYSLPNGNKTWGYFTYKGEFLNKVKGRMSLANIKLDLRNILGYSFNEIDILNNSPYNDLTKKDNEFIFSDVQFIGQVNESNEFTIYVLGQDAESNIVSGSYNTEEWPNLHPKVVGIRLVHFD